MKMGPERQAGTRGFQALKGSASGGATNPQRSVWPNTPV
jgi:hypothetical protein